MIDAQDDTQYNPENKQLVEALLRFGGTLLARRQGYEVTYRGVRIQVEPAQTRKPEQKKVRGKIVRIPEKDPEPKYMVLVNRTGTFVPHAEIGEWLQRLKRRIDAKAQANT